MTTPPVPAAVITPEQQAQERSVLFAVSVDSVLNVMLLVAGLLGGSLTITAEAIRGTLTWVIECFSLVVMRRVHRGVVGDMEFGSGKLEQVVNACLGISLLIAAAWVMRGAIAIMAGQEVGTPLGHASAAIVGIINLYCNLIAWDAVNRAAAAQPSLIMRVQLSVRVVKLMASCVVGTTLTIAALASDELIIAWADAIGSIFVSAYMIMSGVGILRAAIPDILDHAASRAVREAVHRSLARHAGDYETIKRVRSRRSGRVTFIEVALGFDLSLTMAEIDRRVHLLKSTMQREIADSDILIVPSSVDGTLP